MNFSFDAVSPPSSQPAAWRRTLQPPSTAPNRLIIVSYIACASGAFDAFGAEERYGSPTWRASWPLASAALKYSGVPNAGAPDFMSTFEVKAP